MKISYLLFLSCFFYLSIYDVRGNVKIIIEEFQEHFKTFVSQKPANLSCIDFLKNLNHPCPCAIKQLTNIQDFLQNHNSTEAVMMKKNLQALAEFIKSDKSTAQTSRSGRREECKFLCWNPKNTTRKVEDFFGSLHKRKCFKDSR